MARDMAFVSSLHLADANKQLNTVRDSLRASTDSSLREEEDQDMRRFAAVLAQLRHENIASLVSSIRQDNEIQASESSSSPTLAPIIGCMVLPKPLYGSYHLAYRVLYEDGVEWILKIPANGHRACFDRLAVEALTSEALTMRMIKQTTTIPVPTVYHFEASAANEIGCPFIVMDFLKGKPVWQGWFDQEASRSTLEQFRARTLQTIAAAMVQLSKFTFDCGGSLRFDSDGQPVDVAGAKVPDFLAELDTMQGLMTLGEDCPYCEKGPIADPASSFLHTLDRRGFREKDGPYDRGIQELLRLLTEWILENADDTAKNGPQFVLAHPDFALQNFLVEDDGTLCGIIDWDGVAAVPLSVGCLKYPDWLMNDWHPWYHYSPGNAGQQENSTEELSAYRTMYAQFVEASSSVACGSSKAGRAKADITRMSLVAGSLSLAANDLKLTDDAVDIIFENLTAFAVDIDSNDVSDADSASSVETDIDDEDEEVTGEDAVMTEEDIIPIDEEKDGVEHLCTKCTAEPAPVRALQENVAEEKIEMHNSAEVSISSYSSIPAQEHNGASSCGGIRSKETAVNNKVYASRTTKLVKWVLDLGEKGCRDLFKVFHKEEAPKSESTRKTTVAKWALSLGGKYCKRASDTLHMKQDNITETKTTRMRALIQWLVSTLKKNVQKPPKNDTDGTRGPIAAEGPLSAKLVRVDQDHCQKCHPNEKSHGREELNHKMLATEIDPESVWALIAAEVARGGIPIALIKERHDVIAQCVIQNLGQEIEREKELLIQLRNKKAARAAKKAKKQAEMVQTNANHRSNPDPLHHSAFVGSELAQSNLTEVCMAETKAARFGMLQRVAAEREDRETDTTCRFSENGTYPESVIIAPGHSDSEAVDLELIQPSNDEGGHLEGESLLSKLEATKQPLEGQSSGYTNPGPGNTGAEIAQLVDTKPQSLDPEFATPEAVEEANRKLRMVLLGFKKPETADIYLESNVSHGAEDDRVAKERLRSAKSETFKKDKFYEALESANQELRMMLLSIQEADAADANLRPKMPQVEAQLQTSVKGGRWCETPRGSLKRIESGDKLRDSLDEQESTSPTSSCFSAQNGGSSKSSVTSRGDEDLAKVSVFQITFPYHGQSETVNTFQVPNIIDNKEEYNAEGFTENVNTGERDDSEDGEILEEVQSSADDELNGEDEERAGREVDVKEVTHTPKTGEIIDSGYFTLGEVCVALGHGNLDERRMARLKEGFVALLDDAVGRQKR